MGSLRHRADFQRCARTSRRVGPGLTLEAAIAPAEFANPATIRVGFTATKKLGGAVQRNRAKRRLRAAAAAILPLYATGGTDYVLVARAGTLTRRFAELLEDLAAASKALHPGPARIEEPK